MNLHMQASDRGGQSAGISLCTSSGQSLLVRLQLGFPPVHYFLCLVELCARSSRRPSCLFSIRTLGHSSPDEKERKEGGGKEEDDLEESGRTRTEKHSEFCPPFPSFSDCFETKRTMWPARPSQATDRFTSFKKRQKTREEDTR
mmetsp:Transcript_1414/g.2914  ORF Transcript_1414/g.2914 Transcript_1414/m.2914 type:complete len:144 (-) Transcript_1414:1836-2267(-)